MHKHIFILSGRAGRILSSLFRAVLVLSASVTPALAQEAPAGRTGSVLNILLLAVIAYFLIRAFRRRSGNDGTRSGKWSRPDSDDGKGTKDDAADAGRPAPESEPKAPAMDRHEAARRMWESLGADDGAKPAPGPVPSPPTGSLDGFDEAEFLEGAKVFFSRFQQATGEQDLRDLREFMSDDIYAGAVAADRSERIEIMLVDAKLMERKSAGARTVVSVYYDAQLRVGEAGRPVTLRTVWEFSRDESVQHGLWILETINSIDQ